MQHIFIVVMLLYPGESVYEKVAESPVASFEQCRQVQREMRATYKVKPGFQYVTYCYDASTPTTPSYSGMNVDADRANDNPFIRVPLEQK